MSEGFRRPGQGSRIGKTQPFLLRRDAKKGGNKNQATRKDGAVASSGFHTTSSASNKRAREDDEDKSEDIKKARGESYTSPTDSSAFRAPAELPQATSNDSELADFSDGTDEDGDLKSEDVELENAESADVETVDDSPQVDDFYPGLCTAKEADANLTRYKAQQAKEREAREKELEATKAVATEIPDVSATASYNAYKNCPFRDTQILDGGHKASRGEDRFEYGTFSLESDKQYLHWTRFGSEYATVSLKAGDLTHIKWQGEGEFAALEVSKYFPACVEEEAGDKVYDFLFQGEDACQTAAAFGSALKKLRKATRPDPITIPTTKVAQGLPTPADSAYVGSPPPTASSTLFPSDRDEHGHTTAEIAANHAETLIFRTALQTHDTLELWPGTAFTKKAMIAFLTSKDTFHNIVDSTAYARGLGSKSKTQVQALVISYLQTYPLEGAIAPLTVAEKKKLGKPGYTAPRDRVLDEEKKQEGEKKVVQPGLFAAEWDGVHYGVYETNEQAMEVVQREMLKDAQERKGVRDQRLLQG
ncbi:hypothetical protein CLAFUW4_08818 [Fulvia fulva]|uniref:Uncharacterized protein n=1 Tax=Passalora fulva TaxID=5499 RepID=A0A9Q8PFQ2_PASFU|nr:uncharacterized protein CLAFUR5_08925 [Fulvia fulva]KAK4613969.1 hypothetical protein CLAFUR4_08824 [Fulvia fulva]KAK4614767.1 hypothetical protein CLAFUR0_08816 [Fulvia fulva]UJO21589.1 hypothetical protein CLAFUR5_08925 [Fulvia fulva]WPV20425.1 hypothetical protein CLAFUW4_08818 [Fulvia fulva]WPV35559.1 hypothetical protein CLAFUW7_08819 [Fulvia fulva]